MTLTNLIGIGGHALLLSAIILRLTYAFNLRRDFSYFLALAVFVAASAPIGTMPVAQVTRGIFGDMSITSLILLGYFFIFPEISRDKSRQLFILVVTAGLLFYPAALGLGMLDPYQWGYLNNYRGTFPSMLFLAALLAITAIAARLNNALILLCIAAATGAFLIGALESRNIWDYLIDPLIFIFGIFRIGIESTKQFIEKIRE